MENTLLSIVLAFSGVNMVGLGLTALSNHKLPVLGGVDFIVGCTALILAFAR